MEDEEKQQAYEAFNNRVNMSPGDLESWLETEESRSVGAVKDGGESVGHASGRRIVEMKRKRKDELTDADYKHMQKVNGYVARHLAQRPSRSRSELEDSAWRHSLMNWGHDPLAGGDN